MVISEMIVKSEPHAIARITRHILAGTFGVSTEKSPTWPFPARSEASLTPMNATFAFLGLERQNALGTNTAAACLQPQQRPVMATPSRCARRDANAVPYWQSVLNKFTFTIPLQVCVRSDHVHCVYLQPGRHS